MSDTLNGNIAGTIANFRPKLQSIHTMTIMHKQPLPNHFLISLISLDEAKQRPLYGQIYDALREAILSGKLRAGVKLPSSRDLAGLLGISRTTAVNAYDQLLAEGYVESRVGAGTFVSAALPTTLIERRAASHTLINQSRDRPLSTFGNTARLRGEAYGLNRSFRPQPPRAFQLDLPDLEVFPFALWSRLANHHLRSSPISLFHGYSSLAGYPPLREAIAEYLQTARCGQMHTGANHHRLRSPASNVSDCRMYWSMKQIPFALKIRAISPLYGAMDSSGA